jgi:hypothetical protein
MVWHSIVVSIPDSESGDMGSNPIARILIFDSENFLRHLSHSMVDSMRFR